MNRLGAEKCPRRGDANVNASISLELLADGHERMSSCPHLTTLQVAVAQGEIPKLHRENPHADPGARGRARGPLPNATACARPLDHDEQLDDPDWERAARETEQALTSGADIVY